MSDIEQQGRQMRDALRDALAVELEPLGYRPRSYDFEGSHARVSLTFGWVNIRHDFSTIEAQVQPMHSMGVRAVTYRLDVLKADAAYMADRVKKIVAKVRACDEAGQRADEERLTQRRRQETEDRQIVEEVKTYLPDLTHIYGRKFKHAAGVQLEAYVVESRVCFELNVTEYVTAAEAREVIDVLAGIKARRGEQGKAA